MRKSTIILLLIIQIIALFILENLYFLFQNMEQRSRVEILHSLGRVRQLFTGITVALLFSMLITAAFLIYSFKKNRGEKPPAALPPLQDFFLEMKKSQAELRDSLRQQSQSASKKEELNQNIIHSIHWGVILVNAAGKIEIFNPAAQQIFRISYAHAVNQNWQETFRAFPELLATIQAARGKEASEVESDQRIFALTHIPMLAGGKLLLIQDITDEKVKEKIQRLNANFIMLGEMAASLAHEIKNQLGVIYGYCKSLKQEAEKTKKINQTIHNLNAMMESFLSFAKPIEKVALRQTNLSELINEISAPLNLTLHLPEKEMILQSDPILLQVIFANLLRNAQQAGARETWIDFTARERVVITITDNGQGITGKNKDKVWLPFFTTRQEGTGMGLAIVKKCTTALNGDIQLLENAEPGKGARFQITFFT